MEENQISILFDLKYFQENVLRKLLHKVVTLAKNTVSRAVDILFALVLLVFVIPFSLLIKLIYVSNGDFKSIFHVEKCFGKKGKIIHVIKYRSINKDGTTNRLRYTGLDNLPKAINILFGTMAIVGPKPYSVDDKERMGTYFDRIVQMKPGITGISQVSAIKDYSMEMRLDNDIRYFYRKSWFLDLKLVLITTLITLPRRNKGQILSYLNVTIKDVKRFVIRTCDRTVRRTIDIVGSILGIILLIPLTMLVVIVNTVTDSKGPIFYTQIRIGKNGKEFKMYKFRSMIVGADEKLKEVLENDPEARKEYARYKKLKNDPRITVAGKFLRKTSIDEFPQFINVLKGEMSLVGPRPYLVKEKVDMENYYNTIIKHKPGITGLWQITGRSNVTFKDRLELDMEYHKSTNVAYDVKILCKTAMKVLKHDEDAA